MQGVFIQKLSSLHVVAKIILLGIVYWFFCWVGTLTFYKEYGLAIYWPAAGVAITGIYILGRLSSAGIFVASFIINYFIYKTGYTSFPGLIVGVTVIASGNTLGALIGSRCLEIRVLSQDRSFFRLGSVFSFLLFVVFIPSLITSLSGSLVTYMSGVTENLFVKFHSWLLADLTGVLVIVPLLIAWMESPQVKINRQKIPEFIIVLILLLISNYFIFTDFFQNQLYNFLIAYFTTPIYIWLALRFDTKTIISVEFLALIYITYLAIYLGDNLFSVLVEKPYTLLQGFSIMISMFVLIVHSIFTERQQFLVEIRRSEQDLKSVLTNLPLGVGILNSSGEPEYLNKEFTRKTGFGVEEFLNNDNTSHLGGSDNETINFLKKAWKTFIDNFNPERNIEKDISILNKSHEAHDFSLNVNPLKDRYLMVMMDITQRKKMLERIKENERRLSSLIQNLQGIVYQCRFDRNWTMEFVSEGSFLLTGYLPSDFLYNSHIPFASIIHEEYRDYVWDTIERAIKRGEPYNLQYKIISKGGETKWVAENGSGIFDVDGVCRSREGFIYDISERVESEKEIQLLNQNLENKVRKRTEELYRTNQELEAFSYSVSHDLKAPLRAVRGFSALLKEEYGGSLPEGAVHYINNVQKNAENMTQLITDILQFSRMGRKGMTFKSFDSGQLVNTILAEILSPRNPENVEFIVNDLPFINADESLIKQVFINLLSNAVKFSKKDSINRIEISCVSGPVYHEFCISDQGIGFEQKYEEKIFKVFQRLHTSEEFEGSGVGLSIVQRIIHRHGGVIRAISEKNIGTKIFFTIPLEIDSD